jgi:hypothetical protein
MGMRGALRFTRKSLLGEGTAQKGRKLEPVEGRDV